MYKLFRKEFNSTNISEASFKCHSLWGDNWVAPLTICVPLSKPFTWSMQSPPRRELETRENKKIREKTARVKASSLGMQLLLRLLVLQLTWTSRQYPWFPRYWAIHILVFGDLASVSSKKLVAAWLDQPSLELEKWGYGCTVYCWLFTLPQTQVY